MTTVEVMNGLGNVLRKLGRGGGRGDVDESSYGQERMGSYFDLLTTRANIGALYEAQGWALEATGIRRKDAVKERPQFICSSEKVCCCSLYLVSFWADALI